MFTYYYLVMPFLDLIAIFLIYEDELFILIRFMFILIFLFISFNVFIFTYLLTIIGFEAHKSYPILYSIIVEMKLNLKIKFKLLNLIERLSPSSPLIGIYCLDLFPFTNYQFYLFIINCISNFILFMGLFKKINEVIQTFIYIQFMYN